MPAVNDKFPVEAIKTGMKNFKQEATSYLDGGLLIFLGQEDLTETEIKLMDFLKMLQAKTTEIADQQVSFLDIMEVKEYSVEELYQFLDSFRDSYDDFIDSSKTDFLNSIENITEKIAMTNVITNNAVALKMSFIVAASQIVFDNIEEFHNRLKKFIQDTDEL